MTFDVATQCGCACHRTVEYVEHHGIKGWCIDYHWPLYTDPIARVTACPGCEMKHDRRVGLLEQLMEWQHAHHQKHRLTRYLNGA